MKRLETLITLKEMLEVFREDAIAAAGRTIRRNEDAV